MAPNAEISIPSAPNVPLINKPHMPKIDPKEELKHKERENRLAVLKSRVGALGQKMMKDNMMMNKQL